MLSARLRKRMRHLSRWGRRQGIGCFRLFEHDIPDYPVIVDWYADAAADAIATDGHAIVWVRDRKKDETEDASAAFLEHVIHEVSDGLSLARDRIWVKRRGRQRAAEGGRAQYERLDRKGQTCVVEEHGARFEINLSDYLDVGLFLDHRPTRFAIQQRARGRRVLNLFAYTGAFTVHARLGGAAATTTIDLSRTYLEWCERNLALNDLHDAPAHALVHADCLEWLARGPADGEAYDIVICDPPTFSNSKRMRADSFAIERDYPDLLRDLARFVAPGGEIIFSTNARRFDFDDAHLPAGFRGHEISHRSVPEDFRNRRIHRCWRFARSDDPSS